MEMANASLPCELGDQVKDKQKANLTNIKATPILGTGIRALEDR